MALCRNLYNIYLANQLSAISVTIIAQFRAEPCTKPRGNAEMCDGYLLGQSNLFYLVIAYIGTAATYTKENELKGHRLLGVSAKGPSINDVSPKGEGGGYKKCQKRRRLLVDLRRQGEGGYPKNLKFGETSFMDGSLRETRIK